MICYDGMVVVAAYVVGMVAGSVFTWILYPELVR